MPPVYLDDVPEPEEAPHGPNLVTGRDFSSRYATGRARAHSTDSFRRHLALSNSDAPSRPRALSESIRRMGFTHSPQPSFREDDVPPRPRLARTLSPRTGESKRKSFAHSRSHSSPPAIKEIVSLTSTSTTLKDVAEDGKPDSDSDKDDGSFTEEDDDVIRDGHFDYDSPLSADAARGSINGDTSPRQRHLFGYAIPLWMTTRPSGTRISTWIAKHAPCFWCSRQTLSLTTTNQAILTRLGFLCGLCGLLQATSASYLLVVMLSDTIVNRNAAHVDRGTTAGSETVPSLWNVNTFVFLAGFLGTIVFIVMICARRTFRELDLTGSLRFMWLMLWIIPLEVFAAIGMFDYHGVTEVWITHWWSARLMAWFRSKSCALGTYNTECVVPIDGLPEFDTEDEWCMAYYNSTRCSAIKDNAQGNMMRYSNTYYNVNGAVGVITVLLLCLTVNFLESIITRPIVQKSRESNIPLWLTFPIIGCFFTGSVMLFSASSILQRNAGTENFWPGVMFLVAGGCYSMAALLGYFLSHFHILNQRDKRTKRFGVLLFIFVMFVTFFIVAAIFVQSILLSINVVDIPLDDELRGELACTIAEASCSFCYNDTGQQECPEWSDQDVKTVLRTQLKASAALAAIFLIYSLGALRFGFVLRSHIIRYQIDYV